MNFMFKDFYRALFNPYNPRTEPGKFFVGNVVSGAAAGATSLTIVYPLDYARTRLAADVGRGESRVKTDPSPGGLNSQLSLPCRPKVAVRLCLLGHSLHMFRNA